MVLQDGRLFLIQTANKNGRKYTDQEKRPHFSVLLGQYFSMSFLNREMDEAPRIVF